MDSQAIGSYGASLIDIDEVDHIEHGDLPRFGSWLVRTIIEHESTVVL